MCVCVCVGGGDWMNTEERERKLHALNILRPLQIHTVLVRIVYTQPYSTKFLRI